MWLWQNGRSPASVILRMIVFRNEIYRLPQGESICVRAGQAWITYEGEDIVLGRGQKIRLSAGGDFGLVSALGNAPLILEVSCDHSHPHPLRLISRSALAAN